MFIKNNVLITNNSENILSIYKYVTYYIWFPTINVWTEFALQKQRFYVTRPTTVPDSLINNNNNVSVVTAENEEC